MPPLVPLALVCHSHDYVDIRISAVCNKDLGSVELPMVSFIYGSGLLTAGIRSRIRLSESKCP